MNPDDTWHRKEPGFQYSAAASAFSRPATSRQDVLWMVLVWVAVAFVLYEGFVWFQDWRATQVAAPKIPFGEAGEPIPRAQVRAPTTLPPAPRSESRSENAAPPGASGKRSITKCILNGSVSFTDGKCPTGAKLSEITVDVSDLGTVAPRPRQIDPPLASQNVQNVFPQQQPQQSVMIPDKAQMKAAECPSLKYAIEQIDAATRQPLSIQRQEFYKEERRKLRQREYDLGC